VIIKDEKETAEVAEQNWPLVVDLFIKWAYPESSLVKGGEIEVRSVGDILPELSVWGIPWKRK